MAIHFVYEQETGKIYEYGKIAIPTLLEAGYAGVGKGSNNPREQCTYRVGPIPRGVYTMLRSRSHPQLGPVVIPLDPWESNEMCGRSAFYIHGDNAKADRSASEGCIILGRTTREYIARVVDFPNTRTYLIVVEKYGHQARSNLAQTASENFGAWGKRLS